MFKHILDYTLCMVYQDIADNFSSIFQVCSGRSMDLVILKTVLHIYQVRVNAEVTFWDSWAILKMKLTERILCCESQVYTSVLTHDQQGQEGVRLHE